MKLIYSNPKELYSAFNVVKELIDEANLTVNKDGLGFKVPDRAMVCVVDLMEGNITEEEYLSD